MLMTRMTMTMTTTTTMMTRDEGGPCSHAGRTRRSCSDQAALVAAEMEMMMTKVLGMMMRLTLGARSWPESWSASWSASSARK